MGSTEESLSLASPPMSTHVVLYRSKASEAGEAEKAAVASVFSGRGDTGPEKTSSLLKVAKELVRTRICCLPVFLYEFDKCISLKGWSGLVLRLGEKPLYKAQTLPGGHLESGCSVSF